ncbi:hypothetical protein L5515_019238 [Caenorhabditis briggsae]|uniref:Uncharacterized protein n=1 Tax=Caenorhabditis briggsae TaxID=6238 RepID=A0AAE9FJD3_CAEBR|nr:hypothetical protein L5515_019238 [Caenorhabditis briggsae]
MDNVANSTEEAMDDNMTNGTSSNHVSITRGRSRGRPLKIKFGWQRSAVNNARQPTSGHPGSQQPRRGVGRPRWNGIRQQSPRLPPTVQTTTNLSESSPTAIRGSVLGDHEDTVNPQKVQKQRKTQLGVQFNLNCQQLQPILTKRTSTRS